MASRHASFFALPTELMAALQPLLLGGEIKMLMRPTIQEAPREVISIVDEANTSFFLAARKQGARSLDEVTRHPVKFGLVLFDACFVENGVLYLGALSVTDSWVDDHGHHKNDLGLAIFRKAKRALATLHNHDVLGVGASGVGRAYKDIYCSAGAKEFCDKGGRLKQSGVANVVFLPNEGMGAGRS